MSLWSVTKHPWQQQNTHNKLKYVNKENNQFSNHMLVVCFWLLTIVTINFQLYFSCDHFHFSLTLCCRCSVWGVVSATTATKSQTLNWINALFFLLFNSFRMNKLGSNSSFVSTMTSIPLLTPTQSQCIFGPFPCGWKVFIYIVFHYYFDFYFSG